MRLWVLGGYLSCVFMLTHRILENGPLLDPCFCRCFLHSSITFNLLMDVNQLNFELIGGIRLNGPVSVGVF